MFIDASDIMQSVGPGIFIDIIINIYCKCQYI